MPVTNVKEAMQNATLLADDVTGRRPASVPLWHRLVREASGLIQTVLADAPFDGGTTMDPRTVAVCLLLRTVTHFESAVFLAERGAAASALSLARSCLEDGFVMTELVDRPQEMLDRLKGDFERSRKSQIAIVQKQSLADDDVLKELGTIADALGKGRFISFDEIAGQNPQDTRYLLYRVLSAHAVHCSADSLQRFLSIEDGKWTSFRLGLEDGERMPSVFRYICLAALPTAAEFARLFGMSANEEQAGRLIEWVADQDVPKDWFVYP